MESDLPATDLLDPPALEPAPDVADSPPPGPERPARIWTRPGRGVADGIDGPLASCADERCQQARPVGRSPAGWVAVRRTDTVTVWCCSYRCASIVCLRSELMTGDTGP